ncbi:MAG: AAA family ATPase [Candidatus Paceibacterota bacterium]
MKSPEFSPESIKPIAETETSVSYLGVELSKSQNRENAPDPSKYEDYINDNFTLPFQRDIAVSFAQGDPILIEGGTSIGKTTTLRKMAADLGWEVHYVNLNGATDASDLMGRYIPNPNKKTADDPEYIFADGSVTSGLRVEEGKQKLLILDELNASSPGNLIRLHEVLDALERNGQVVLSEDASEKIATDRKSTHVAALINPPGKGFMQREALDPAQLRRWVYRKAPTELPAESFNEATDSLFNVPTKNKKEIPKEAFLYTNEAALSPEDLGDIPGIKIITEKYKEFHKAAKEMVAKRKIAADQPQPFSYDDRMEPRRVRDFLCRFYRGDVNETFQAALRYYYSGKILDQAEKQKLEELIKHVSCPKEALSNPKRKGLGAAQAGSPEVNKTGLSVEEAAQIFEEMDYKEGFIGPSEIAETFGFFKLPEAPPVPFTREVLEQCKEFGLQLVLQVGRTDEGEVFNIAKMQSSFTGMGGVDVFFEEGINQADKENIGIKETPRYGWKLAGNSNTMFGTTGDYLEQLSSSLSNVQHTLYGNNEVSDRYKKANKELDDFISQNRSTRVPNVLSLANTGIDLQTSDIKKLHANNLIRERACEIVYREIINFNKGYPESLEGSREIWTNSFASANFSFSKFVTLSVENGDIYIKRKRASDLDAHTLFSTMVM